MRLRLRATIVAMALVVGTYPVVGAPSQAAAAPVAETTATSDIRIKLPSWRVWGMAVDDTHRMLFATLPTGLLVMDFAGQTLHNIPGVFFDVAVAADNSELYVIEQTNRYWLRTIKLPSFETSSVPLPACHEALGLAVTGGKVWYSYQECLGSHALGMYDPATGQLNPDVLPLRSGGPMRALPDRPDRLLVLGMYRDLGVYDVSAGVPTVVAETRLGCDIAIKDAALVAGGELFVASCPSANEYRVFRTVDLGREPWEIPIDYLSGGVAATPDGHHVAVGYRKIRVYDIRDGIPGTLGREYQLPEGSRIAAGSLEFSATGRLFAVESATDGKYLNIFPDATTHLTQVTISVPKVLEYQGTVVAAGTLSFLPDTAITARLTRTDRRGTRDLGLIEISGDFTFRDTPGTTGPVTYTVHYPGDPEHPAATGTATTIIRPLPYDVNADGYAELVTGVPGEALGSITDAGQFHLLYGSANGPQTSGSLVIHQNTPGVPGTAEPGDSFGETMASGDLNHDGFADVVVSAPTEDIGTLTDTGAIWIFYGSAAGLRTDNVRVIDPYDVPASDRDRARFGSALAMMDFDDNLADDLVIGAPGAGGGRIVVMSSDGSFVSLDQADTRIPGEDNPGDQFGRGLAAADVNGDGRRDLAVGAPQDAEDLGWATGSVTVLYTGATGINWAATQRITKQTSGVPGNSGSFDLANGDAPDEFGLQLTSADFSGDGEADLAVAAPGAPVYTSAGRLPDAGTVTVLYGSASQISTGAEVRLGTDGIPGSPGAHTRFPAAMASGETTGDGKAELAVSVVSGYQPYVVVIPGGSSYVGSVRWSQESAGVPGTSEVGDAWGSSLRFFDPRGAGLSSRRHSALLVGAAGENVGAGSCTLIPAGSAGLTGTGSRYYSQNTTGMPGVAEPADRFGTL